MNVSEILDKIKVDLINTKDSGFFKKITKTVYFQEHVLYSTDFFILEKNFDSKRYLNIEKRNY